METILLCVLRGYCDRQLDFYRGLEERLIQENISTTGAEWAMKEIEGFKTQIQVMQDLYYQKQYKYARKGRLRCRHQ